MHTAKTDIYMCVCVCMCVCVSKRVTAEIQFERFFSLLIEDRQTRVDQIWNTAESKPTTTSRREERRREERRGEERRGQERGSRRKEIAGTGTGKKRGKGLDHL